MCVVVETWASTPALFAADKETRNDLFTGEAEVK
ncbi:hypothetical protein SAZ_04100 [Streptomyces noursei ZPM]|uniref:Uncharacterized protein n=1 Tax=Streptomyces noursei TaxID=1971 RepID=A0A059VW07_STRNR|nr:hypothetical protein DC74_679 [Streptomyces noursei]AKA08446.1 hypothetical protein SAZ_04100 [Streptomyces noursei ZPM]EPY92468.1 hypothetical protein K530_53100 [Streptomyces noursei CCRC 11814]GCB88854.1 hypothetical protein SALB_01527 [Streptomyces noursei]